VPDEYYALCRMMFLSWDVSTNDADESPVVRDGR
jgi:hypothetical protein